MPLILPARTLDSGYEISNSLRFDGTSTYMNRHSIGNGNRRSWTFSMWVKKSKIINNTEMFCWSSNTNGADGDTHDGGGFYGIVQTDITANANHNYFVLSDGDGRIISSANARDVSAWQHMVWQVDTASSTENDRLKLYINGERVTSHQKSQEQVAQNKDTNFNRNGSAMYIGNDQPYTRYYFDGYMAEVAFIDGQSYDASQFGETNSNGVWVPKEFKDDVTFGTNGFYLEFKQTGTSQNSSGIGADTSGNDNHFAVNNLASTDVTVDTPTNNFATMIPLSPTQGSITYAEGNLKISASGTSSYSYFPSTFGLSNGKWYAEVKINSQGGNTFVGIAETTMEKYYTGAGNDPHLTAGTVWYAHGGNGYYDGSSQNASTFGADSFTSGDIIGFALDLDSGTRTIKFYKNGSLTTTKNLTSNFVDPIVFAATLYNTQNQSWNFGNPDFSISSGNADANGYGNFEYAPPSGYYACCTKNLAEFG